MNIDERVRKVEGHTAALLDAYRGLRQTFALLEPLLPGAVVSEALSQGPTGEGLEALRQTLFLACALDVAKLCLDGDARAPSIAKLVDALKSPDLVDTLRSRSTQYRLPRDADDGSDEASLCEFERKEAEARARAFDERLALLSTRWADLEERLAPLAVLRDKYVAHLELSCIDGAYAPIDLARLGLKWSDLGAAIAAMEPLVADLGAIIRSVSFDMSGAVQHFEQVRDSFWARAR